MNVRTLRADEVEARVQTVKENGCSLLLYKDARCDMKILDETFGVGNWQRSHEVINGNLFCNVGVRFERGGGFGDWVWKQDVGTESYTEKEKGQASDSFKRACFNWGIGRELYTAPFIWISLKQGEVYKNGNKYGVKTRFAVKEIAYNDDREITKLTIVDDKNNVRYELGKFIKADDKANTPSQVPTKIDKNKVDTLNKLVQEKKTDMSTMLKYYKVSKVEDMTVQQWTHAMERLNEK